jgi:16S rRNA processing protein RimM
VATSHGVSGEVRVKVLTDFPDRFDGLETIYLGEEFTPVVVEGHRKHGSNVLLKLIGVDQREEADKLRGLLVRVPIDQAVPLEEDEYYVHEIVGLEVWTVQGEHLGRVTQVLETGSNDVYVIRDGAREILIPALSDVVLGVDLEEGRIEVQLMKGLG